jgi:hypothetical protein
VCQANSTSKLREIVNRFEELKPTCLRGLLKERDIIGLARESREAVEGILEYDSIPYRLFTKSHLSDPLEIRDIFANDETFVRPGDCRRVDDWIALLLSLIREIDPLDFSSDFREDLRRELEAQKRLMAAVATGGPSIKTVNQEYQERQQWITERLKTLGLKNTVPYADLWDWYGKWSSGDLPTYQSRRSYLADLFRPMLRQLEDSGAEELRAFPEPTGWEKIDKNLALAQRNLMGAQTELELQNVGLICRETLTDLAQQVFSSEKHTISDVNKVSKTDAKRMLDAYISHELGGASNEEVRGHAKAASKLANALTHRRTAAFREAALCLEATASLINIIAIISGQRDPS